MMFPDDDYDSSWFDDDDEVVTTGYQVSTAYEHCNDTTRHLQNDVSVMEGQYDDDDGDDDCSSSRGDEEALLLLPLRPPPPLLRLHSNNHDNFENHHDLNGDSCRSTKQKVCSPSRAGETLQVPPPLRKLHEGDNNESHDADDSNCRCDCQTDPSQSHRLLLFVSLLLFFAAAAAGTTTATIALLPLIPQIAVSSSSSLSFSENLSFKTLVIATIRDIAGSASARTTAVAAWQECQKQGSKTVCLLKKSQQPDQETPSSGSSDPEDSGIVEDNAVHDHNHRRPLKLKPAKKKKKKKKKNVSDPGIATTTTTMESSPLPPVQEKARLKRRNNNKKKDDITDVRVEE